MPRRRGRWRTDIRNDHASAARQEYWPERVLLSIVVVPVKRASAVICPALHRASPFSDCWWLTAHPATAHPPTRQLIVSKQH